MKGTIVDVQIRDIIYIYTNEKTPCSDAQECSATNNHPYAKVGAHKLLQEQVMRANNKRNSQ